MTDKEALSNFALHTLFIVKMEQLPIAKARAKAYAEGPDGLQERMKGNTPCESSNT